MTGWQRITPTAMQRGDLTIAKYLVGTDYVYVLWRGGIARTTIAERLGQYPNATEAMAAADELTPHPTGLDDSTP